MRVPEHIVQAIQDQRDDIRKHRGKAERYTAKTYRAMDFLEGPFDEASIQLESTRNL